MEFIPYLGQENVFTFMFLLGRLGGMMLFFPFFSHTSIPIVVKTSLIVIFTFIFFPMAKLGLSDFNVTNLVLGFVMEIFLGLCAGIILNFIFAGLQLAGEQISFVMGFTMASVMDPQTGISTPLISQTLTLIALTIFLAFDGHHLILYFFFQSLGSINLGAFYPDVNIYKYIASNVTNLFLMGFGLAFPIMALSLLSDVIFGMLMKTMPQFNLLVVGFPIKIILAFSVLFAVLGSIMYVFKEKILYALNVLASLFF